MSISPMILRSAIESRAFYAARRTFGRYGVDVSDDKTTPEMLRAAMRRMNSKEYKLIIMAFAAVMSVNGRIRPAAPEPLSEAQMYDNLQKTARHLAHHHEDLPKVAS